MREETIAQIKVNITENGLELNTKIRSLVSEKANKEIEEKAIEIAKIIEKDIPRMAAVVLKEIGQKLEII